MWVLKPWPAFALALSIWPWPCLDPSAYCFVDARKLLGYDATVTFMVLSSTSELDLEQLASSSWRQRRTREFGFIWHHTSEWQRNNRHITVLTCHTRCWRRGCQTNPRQHPYDICTHRLRGSLQTCACLQQQHKQSTIIACKRIRNSCIHQLTETNVIQILKLQK